MELFRSQRVFSLAPSAKRAVCREPNLEETPPVSLAFLELLERGSLVETHERQKNGSAFSIPHHPEKQQSVLRVTSVVCRARFSCTM